MASRIAFASMRLFRTTKKLECRRCYRSSHGMVATGAAPILQRPARHSIGTVEPSVPILILLAALGGVSTSVTVRSLSTFHVVVM
jgi:hypothetical protein